MTLLIAKACLMLCWCLLRKEPPWAYREIKKWLEERGNANQAAGPKLLRRKTKSKSQKTE